MRSLRIGLVAGLVALTCAAMAADSRKTLKTARMRSGPGVYFPLVTSIERGEKLFVLEKSDRWYKVKTAQGQQGWVSSKVFDTPKKPQGYGKVLTESGLSGASTTVVTMATRGLSSGPLSGQTGLDPLLREFISRAAFRPEGLGDFMERLEPGACDTVLAAVEGDGQLEGDPDMDELERRLGLALAAKLLGENTLVTDSVVDDYVNKVGMAIAMHSSRYDLSWRFLVLKKKEARALALPGGLVVLTSGLLEELSDEAELAAVLGHAVAHVVLGHGAEKLEEALESSASASEGKEQDERGKMVLVVEKAYALLETPRSAGQELEADALGAALCVCAGYDGAALGDVLGRAVDFEPAAADHPPASVRIERIEKICRAAGKRPGARLKGRFEKKLTRRAGE